MVKGSGSRDCNRCGLAELDIEFDLDPDAHDYEYDPNATPPTCLTPGQGLRTCKRDGCTFEENTNYPALGHQGLTPAFAATCTTAGNSQASGACSRPGCGQIVTGTVIPALGHQGLTPAFAATCTTAGNSQASGTCSRPGCGQVFTGTVIPALGHDFNWEMAGIKTCKRNNCNANPVIGNRGPAGGIIFHINPAGFTVQGYSGGSGLNFTGYTAHYFEAAPDNMATTLTWATNNELIPGLSQNSGDQTDWAIGRGRMNTAIIIAHGITFSPPYTTPAASACVALTTGGKTDWFLPSRNESNALAQIRGQYGIPNTGIFWSSSQNVVFAAIPPGAAWNQSFANGSQGSGSKNGANVVRAVRAF